MISENSENSPIDLNALSSIDAGDIIDSQMSDNSLPFVYVAVDIADPNTMSDGKYGNKGIGLYVGAKNHFHSSILTANNKNSKNKRLICAIDRDGEPGLNAVGRVAYGIDSFPYEPNHKYRYDERLKDIQLVAYYISDYITSDVINQCNKELLKAGLVTGDAYFVYAGQVRKISGEEKPLEKATEDQKRRGALQVALHLGNWPDGRRLTGKERKDIEEELGIDRSKIEKNPTWAGEARKAGITIPGQKWWAMHSEGKSKK